MAQPLVFMMMMMMMMMMTIDIFKEIYIFIFQLDSKESLY